MVLAGTRRPQTLQRIQPFLTPPRHGSPQRARAMRANLKAHLTYSPFKEKPMPIIAWLLGVPISVILILMLFGVF